jgi:hypothetical protein
MRGEGEKRERRGREEGEKRELGGWPLAPVRERSANCFAVMYSDFLVFLDGSHESLRLIEFRFFQ